MIKLLDRYLPREGPEALSWLLRASLSIEPKPAERVLSIEQLERMLWEKTRNLGREQIVFTDGKILRDVCAYSTDAYAEPSVRLTHHFIQESSSVNLLHYHTHPHVNPDTGKPFTTITVPSSGDLSMVESLASVGLKFGKLIRGRIVEKFGVWEYQHIPNAPKAKSYNDADKEARAVVANRMSSDYTEQAKKVVPIYEAAGFACTYRKHPFVE